MYYIPYLVIFLGLIFSLLILINHYKKQKSLPSKFIDKQKYFHYMNILFLFVGSIYIILGLLSLFNILSINILTALTSITTISYLIKMLSITKKYGQPKNNC